jgi:hypothetical protein
MSKLNMRDWQVVVKIIMAIASALLGALGAQDAVKDE